MPTQELTCIPQDQCALFNFCTQIVRLDPTTSLNNQQRSHLINCFNQVINDPDKKLKILGNQLEPSCVTFHNNARNLIPDRTNGIQAYIFLSLMGLALENNPGMQKAAQGWYTLYTGKSLPEE